jgi:putative membrane-bound dehydrogenase-like protein
MLLTLLLAVQDMERVDELGLRVARGFRVSMISTPDVANDLYCMTLDPKGRIVVSSAGWIKTLHDDDGDGKMDRSTTFAETRTGAMGLHFEGNDLYASCDGHVTLFRDKDGDGKADGPGEPLFKLLFGEHGAHAIRKGPDGKLYVMGGNDAGITAEHANAPGSPVKKPEAGALIRFSPDGKEREVLAHGFRNAYDFDFNAKGDVFTYDSDCERDYFLPWYTPTRVYHVQMGMHHGWRLPGWTRSFARRDYGIDTVEMLVPVGRGSPTGVLVYKHDAFPERYRGGLFYADWTFGKVFFTPLVPHGSTYVPNLIETFLEPSGSDGFAPTDLVVAPDGALLVSIGGRRTRGAIFRIEGAAKQPLPFAASPPPPAVDRRAIREAALRGEGALGKIWKGEAAVDDVLREFKGLDAVRLLQLALGDCDIHRPPVEVQSMYCMPKAPAADVRAKILAFARPLFPSGDARLDLETSRLLAMLEDDDLRALARTAARITAKSDPTSDVHYLIVLSRLKAAWPEGIAEKAADALLSLSRKLAGQEMRSKQQWGERLAELAKIFASRDPGFARALLEHRAFVSPAHVDVAAALGGPDIARRFLAAATSDADFVWSERLLALLAALPPAELHPALRAQWSNFGLRDAIILHLATKPEAVDRDKYLAALDSANPAILNKALDALQSLPRSPEDVVPALKVLRRLTLEPKAGAARGRLAALAGGAELKEVETSPKALRELYQPLFAGKKLEDEDPAALRTMLEGVAWDVGSAERGAEVFRARGCQTCHAAQGALGPNLAGAAARFSREDLLEAIGNPSKDVAPPYRTTAFQTKDGAVHTGMVAFSSADGYIVQTGATTTVRLAAGDVLATKPGARSLMPDGLLTGLKPAEIADLYAYLRALK